MPSSASPLVPSLLVCETLGNEWLPVVQEYEHVIVHMAQRFLDVCLGATICYNSNMESCLFLNIAKIDLSSSGGFSACSPCFPLRPVSGLSRPSQTDPFCCCCPGTNIWYSCNVQCGV